VTKSDFIYFTKMQGLGNDFIVLDSTVKPFSPKALERLAPWLCHRHFGIGADGLIYLEPKSQYLSFSIYNPDGSEAETCGNGLRCAVKYYFDHQLAAQPQHAKLSIKLSKTKKMITAKVFRVKGIIKEVEIDMGKPEILWQDKPFSVGRYRLRLNHLSMGNPHCVVWRRITDYEVGLLGPVIEKDALFPQGTNVEFAKIISEREVQVKVWERGAGLTLACGSGACAVFALGLATGRLKSPAKIKLPGGTLTLRSSVDGHIYMRGAAEEVYTGSFKVSRIKEK
jgi:diaminopimelate epimerase